MSDADGTGTGTGTADIGDNNATTARNVDDQQEQRPNKLEWPVDRVRSTFVDFFVKEHGHTPWPSSPCVPHDDPTLLFANAGMNQYKPLFLGTCDPNLEMSTLKRAANSQKCIRAGGKHNDLDDVGKDVYHHTFFEMLGNWSFGDYFKVEAIAFAWECLVDVYGLNPDRLYATYFGGDESSPEDVEARELWLKYLPAERVLPFDATDNFWEMGATGPCGPCTEIHYDRIGDRDASSLVNADLPDVIEIWNVVFIQYNREPDGELRPLPLKHIDTGMGLERVTSILQNVDSNYDTDVFVPIFDELYSILCRAAVKNKGDPSAIPRYQGRVGADDSDYVDMAYRVIADHIRTLCFSIADGAMPSNDGRGYVLRRVLRRAVRYGRSNLNADLGFFNQLVNVVVRNFGGAYPELVDKEEFIRSVLTEEEVSFGRTLDKGLIQFERMAAKCIESGSTVFSGEDAHALYTSMGFPDDLTELMAEERGLTLDVEAFKAMMDKEKILSAAALEERQLRASGGVDMTLEAEQTNYLAKEADIDVTIEVAKYERVDDLEATVLELYVGRNATDKYGFMDSIRAQDVEGRMIGVISDRTSFYAESGGQVADTGALRVMSSSSSSDGGVVTMKVENVQVYAGYIVHSGRLLSGTIHLGDKVLLNVDYERRRKIESNHTMTHVLNFALKDALVLHPETAAQQQQQELDQKGSLVDEYKLRFDFSWSGPLNKAQLSRIERMCSERIKFAIPVEAFVAPLPDAQKISSLRAVFGETYPDPVRVVSVAPVPLRSMLEDPTSQDWMDYSVEFCGGTHLSNTCEAEDFVLLSEEGIAKGVRRITAVTMQTARLAKMTEGALQQKLNAADSLEGLQLEAEIKKMTGEVNQASISAASKMAMRESLASYGKRVVAWKKEEGARMTSRVVETLKDEAKKTDDEASLVVCRFDFGIDGKVAKAVMTAHGKQKDVKKPFLMVTADRETDRFMVFASAPKGCSPNVNCKDWVAAATEGTGAKGGGKKDSAQFNASGVDANVDKVLSQARAYKP